MLPRSLLLPSLALLTFIGLGTSARAQEAAQPTLPTVKLTAGMHVLKVEVARSPGEHTVGLMFRKSMATNDGMLFIFDEPAQQCFWMRNTVLPLSAAFISDDGSIANIEDMAPRTLDSHCSVKPVRYVLEMNQGWFAKRGLKAGMKLRGSPFAAS